MLRSLLSSARRTTIANLLIVMGSWPDFKRRLPTSINVGEKRCPIKENVCHSPAECSCPPFPPSARLLPTFHPPFCLLNLTSFSRNLKRKASLQTSLIGLKESNDQTQLAPTHCKSHTAQVEAGLQRPVPLQPLLCFHGHQQSGSGQKAPQIKMGTPVISLHRWSALVADCFHHCGGKRGLYAFQRQTVLAGNTGLHGEIGASLKTET